MDIDMAVGHGNAVAGKGLPHALVHAKVNIPVVRVVAPEANNVFHIAVPVTADHDHGGGIGKDLVVRIAKADLV